MKVSWPTLAENQSKKVTDLQDDAICAVICADFKVVLMLLLTVNLRWAQQECHLTVRKFQCLFFSDQGSLCLMDHATHNQSCVFAEKWVIQKASFATLGDVGVSKIKSWIACNDAIAKVVVHLLIFRNTNQLIITIENQNNEITQMRNNSEQKQKPSYKQILIKTDCENVVREVIKTDCQNSVREVNNWAMQQMSLKVSQPNRLSFYNH